MTDSEMPCRGNYGECPKPAVREDLCWGHVKAAQRGKSVNFPLKERPASQLERAMEAGIRYLEAEGQAEYDRAEKEWKKAIAAAGAEARREIISACTKRAMARAKDNGVHVGRPRKVLPEQVMKALLEAGSVRGAAAQLKVHESTVWRAKRIVRQLAKGDPFCQLANNAT